jgi:predicted kinase
MIKALCGFPGSGKSSYLKDKSGIIVCPDEFRKVLTGQIFYRPAEEAVWSAVKTCVRVFSKQNKQDVIIDATNLTKGQRAQWVQIAKELNVDCECIWIATPFEVCLERNKNREAVVPYDVMLKMQDMFEPPSEEEGFKLTIC